MRTRPKYEKINSVWITTALELAIAKQVYGHITYDTIKANIPIKKTLFDPVKSHYPTIL